MTAKTSPIDAIQELSGQPPSAAALRELQALRGAVAQALDRKRRLGQYAVVWEQGAVRTLSAEALPVLHDASAGWGRQGQSPSGGPLSLVVQEPQAEAWSGPRDPAAGSQDRS